MRLLLTLSLLTLFFPVITFAQDGNGLNLPPAGQTILNLSASERREVTQDLLVASLRIEVDDKDARSVQEAINKAMQNALEFTKTDPAIEVSTGGYHVYQYDPNPEPPQPMQRGGKNKKEMRWRGSQTITLESKDSAKLLDMTGKIQDMGFAMNGLNYTLSPEKMESIYDDMMVAALKKLREKADLARKTLGKGSYELVDVNLDSGGMPYPQPMYMMKAGRDMAMAESMAAPSAEPGQSEITVSVSARALLKP